MKLEDIKYFVGLDVAKDTIAVYFSETDKFVEICNNNKAFNKHLKSINPKNTLAVMETTGGYENECIKWLTAHNIPIFKVDNKKFKEYKKSSGVKAKTDKIDAIMLAKYGLACKFENSIRIYNSKDCEIENLRQHTTYLVELRKMRAAEKNRLQSPGFEYLKKTVEETVNALTKRIKIVENKIKELVKRSDQIKRKIKLLSNYRGVGDETALFLLLNMSELGTMENTEAAALGGLAPRNNDSGKSTGYRSIKGSGRPIIRKIMYMSAMANIRKTSPDNPIKTLYNKLRAKGKRKMVALVACMRKMLVQINAILRDGENKCEKMKKTSSQLQK